MYQRTFGRPSHSSRQTKLTVGHPPPASIRVEIWQDGNLVTVQAFQLLSEAEAFERKEGQRIGSG